MFLSGLFVPTTLFVVPTNAEGPLSKGAATMNAANLFGTTG
jgi:hypothetical protein